ncbi:MAG: PAS domain S-box protein, partial [Anaerolineaceae bacterium]|nr:PAS domain S-box protein [Anaerolineaceae bacterium]
MTTQDLAQVFLDSLPCISLLLKTHSREIIAANKSALDAGITPGKLCHEAWFGRSEPCRWCRAPELWKTGKPQQVEVEDSGIIWDVHWVPVDKDSYLHYAFDITERKHIEQALRLSQERFQTLVQYAPDGILVYDLNQDRIVEANNLLGYSRGALLGKKWLDISAPQQPGGRSAEEWVEKLEDAALKSEDVSVVEWLFVSANGEEVLTELRLTRLPPSYQKLIRASIIDITARKRLEEELRQSEERFRVALENSQIVVFNQDQELRYTWVYNPNLGLDPIAILGKTDADLLPVEDATRLTEIKRRVLETGVPTREEVRTTIDGQAFFYDLVVEALRDASGTITGITCASIDITERVQAEKVLIETETRFRGLFENINNGVAVYDVVGDGADFIFKDFNAAAEKIDHEKREDLIGKSIFEARPGINEFGLIDVLKRVWKTGNSERLPISEYKDEKLIGWYDNFIYKLPSGEIVAVFENVTERKQAEEALRASESRYRAVVEDQMEFISRMDLDLAITFANDAYCRFRNRTQQDLIGQKLADITGESIAGRIRATLDELTPENPVITSENHRLMPDGNVRWIRWTNRMIMDDEGNPIEYQSVGHDITERVRAEEGLRESERRLKV